MKDYLVPGNLRDMMEEMDTDITAIQPQLAEVTCAVPYIQFI